MALKRRRLADRRKSVGHTQESLAEKLGVDRTTVVRWERAESEPQPWVRQGLAEALRISVDRLAELLRDVEEAGTRRAGRLAHTLRNPRAADLPDVAHLQHELDKLTREYDTKPSTSVLPDAGRLHGEVALLRQRATGEGTRRALRAAEAKSATFIGQLIWDASQRRDRTALTYFEHAIDAARQADTPLVEAHAHLRTSFVALYGDKDPREGLVYASRAANLASHCGSHALCGFSLLHVAEANAMMGERRACEQALDEAARNVDQVDGADPAGTVVSAQQIERMAGSCYLFLGDARRAQALLEGVSARLHDRKKSRAIVLGNLALAYLRQRQVEAASTALHEAIDVLERTRGGGGLNVLFTASREMRPWRERPDVQDVTDRIFALMVT
jgi:transcriptional regulator with XRE-family HTH domain